MRRLVCLAETDSTNNWLKRQSALRAFTSVRAVLQSAGRGRAERSWFSGSPGDNLAFSILLPYDASLAGLLPAHVALVCHEVLSHWISTRIKWPNDILFEGRKLAGILCESFPAEQNLFIVGIGMNVAQRDFPPDLRDMATSLAQATGQLHDAGSLWLRLTRALWREFRRPRTAQEIIPAYDRVAVRYHRRREYPGEILEFETLLSDGRAAFLLGGERLMLDQAS
ncbi:MAG TPA: biotin--[acetyl-CoA-carboxylase] ligase [Turneriella sp.]|nr:biotin--[acetyl-CoA-carboxylase] ligase [Turneriella sp.]HMY12161.1 biotin--[acetyl-CoA-carboxylase] ligase [Turneriella sp.]HNA78598.1 biotin--[acetyl-CoA-carboxylase] ligase [Turneriella sp.]HNE18336.1 biotin--[acetyl-CoA-carboxylase] ligase [Turneriella sp.]HNJ64598.1 biotin--[acetyl-CoA-carboxylase] ligase [Turneriella sp.]